jgi:hypothetical protein
MDHLFCLIILIFVMALTSNKNSVRRWQSTTKEKEEDKRAFFFLFGEKNFL